MLSAGASELTMSQWSSLFAEMGLGVPKVVGDLVGPALFAFFMVVGRTIYGLRGATINLEKALQDQQRVLHGLLRSDDLRPRSPAFPAGFRLLRAVGEPHVARYLKFNCR